MPNSNGRIYVDGTGDVTYGVSFADVQTVLGTTADTEQALCQHSSINKWARYKPVVYRGFPIRFSGNTDFDEVTGLNVGSMIDSPSSVAGFSDIEITYTKPFGGMASPYRISDFNKYNHYAEKPVEIGWSQSFKTDRSMICVVSIYDRTSDADSSEYISFSDVLNEISGSGSFKNRDKRLCLAVFHESDDTNPVWYFFSDKFSNVGSSGVWSVSTRMDNPIFSDSHIGETYKFVVMLVSDHDALNDIVTGTDRYVWESGVSPSDMASMESGSNAIQAMCLAFEKGADRHEAVLQEASVISEITYHLDVLSVERYGDIVQSGNFNILCTQLYLPEITLSSPSALNDAACLQMRASFGQGSTSFGIFLPKSGDGGGNYYEADFGTASTSLPETPITSWVKVSDLPSGNKTVTDGKYIYEFDMFNFEKIILSQTAEQTQGLSKGLFLFFDQDTSAGTEFDVTFSLYYRASSTSGEIRVRSFSVTYNTRNGSGMIHDLDF